MFHLGSQVKHIDWNTAIELCSPFPYVLVVTCDKQGNPNAQGATWWTFTSTRPPMLAICIAKTHYTHQCLEDTREFVLCFPSEKQAIAAWVCGRQSGRRIDKFLETGLTTVPSQHVRPPSIEGVVAAFECRVMEQMDCPGHTLFNSRVLAMYGDAERGQHLYTVAYKKLVSMDHRGNVNWDI